MAIADGACRPNAYLERVPSIHVMHPCPPAPKQRVIRAKKRLIDLVQRVGYAEVEWVAEELAFEFGIGWNGDKLMVSLSDLQLIAFTAALRAHVEAQYPSGMKVRVAKREEEAPAGTRRNSAQRDTTLEKRKKRVGRKKRKNT